MAKTKIGPSELSEALQAELRLYHADVISKVNAAGEKAIKALVKKTNATAPKRSGDFRKAITYTTETNRATGDTEYVWGAKAPHYRLTHLLVKGHLKADGDRVDGDPFLANALEEVLPEYEREVKEAIENAD